MALFHPGMKCPICGMQLGSENIFATWGVFLPEGDPLWRFCDACMHWACYEAWPPRLRFARTYFDFWVKNEKINYIWGKAYCDDFVLVTLNPCAPIEEVSVRFSTTGSDVRVKLDRWREWLCDPKSVSHELRPSEKEALDKSIDVLRTRYSTGEKLIHAVDWESKKKLVEEENLRLAKAEEQRLQAVAIHNKACWKMELQRKHGGLTCKNCGQHSNDFRFMDNAPQRKSYFICNKCAHTLEPD